MSLPSSQLIPDPNDPASHSAARRRRTRRQIVPPTALTRDQRSAFIDRLAQRTNPTFDFFFFSLVCGLLAGLGALIDNQALLVLAVLLAPCLTPVVGLSLATIAGSGRFFLKTLGNTLLGGALVFLGGFAAGYGRLLVSIPTQHHAADLIDITWPNLLMLGVGSILTTISLVRSERKPLIPSAALAYVIYLPVAYAGFGLSTGNTGLWPTGLIVFTICLTGSVLLGTVSLGLMGFRPLTWFGYTLGTTIALTSVTVMAGLSGLGGALRAQVPMPTLEVSVPSVVFFPTHTHTPAPTNTPSPVPTATPSPVPPTLTPTQTLVPSRTPTITATLKPTPVWASIQVPGYSGAVIRVEPDGGGKILTSILNGTLVEVLPEITQNGNLMWAHVRTLEGVEGWIVQSLLMTATPAPGW